MPVRDAASTVTAAVQSVQAQIEPRWELVAVDDGSTDGTGPVVDAHAGRDPHLRLGTP